MYISPLYLLLVGVTLALGLSTQAYVNHMLKKYSREQSQLGITGAEMANKMLADSGVHGVKVLQGSPGQDHYNPKNKSISLSPEVYGERTITAMSVACHEVGHAVQHAESYTPMTLRSAIIPVVNFTSNIWMFVFLAGVLLAINGLIDLAIILYSIAIVFQLVTLPVELNASRRAMAYLNAQAVAQTESNAAFSVLRACALTYVAAALSSILQLLYLLSQRR